MRIDLHTHSSASDGTDAPAEVIRLAQRAGLDVVALTDHDSARSWPEASAAAQEVGITLVRGIEVSTKHEGRSVHLLAYLPDPTYEPLVTQLDLILEGRNNRVAPIVAKLRELDYDVSVDDVLAQADASAAAGRPHVADALVARGLVRDRNHAFDTLLNPGRPAYVHRYAAALVDMVPLIVEAGGVPVVAHPWGRHGPNALPAETIALLAERGLAGLEVDHQDHDASQREELRAIARSLDLIVTGSSDYHGTGKVDHDLGCNLTAPEEYERLLAKAAAIAATSGRGTGIVVAPGSESRE